MGRHSTIGRVIFCAGVLACAAGYAAVTATPCAYAADAQQLNKDADYAMKTFERVTGSGEVLRKAKGLLIFPAVYKGGIGIGAEYGEGVLRIRGRTVDYYNTAAASIGLQLGGQKKTIIMAFMNDDALRQFRDSSGWKVGVDASVAVIAIGAGGAIDSASLNKPIIAFVFDQKGLMYNITLEGAKITKIKK